MNDNLLHFLTALSAYEGENVFNPWRDTDADYEVNGAISIRKEQLTAYLARRLKKAKILLIAEACGYQGGHFSGIAMTCERMILNQHPKVTSQMILGREGKRTSRMDSVVWSACLEAGLAPDEFLLWNIFPFHPYKKGNLLTNRTPTNEELAIGLTYTKELLSLTGTLPLFAIGRKSEMTLTEAGFSVTGLRHPANGGAGIFRAQLKEAMG